MTQQILKNSWWKNVWFLCSVTLVLCKVVQFSLETDSCCGNGNKLVVAWAFPRDHIGVLAQLLRKALGHYVTTVPTTPMWHSGPGNN